MARPLRIEYAGAVYHVVARGNQGRAIWRDDRDRHRFLETLGEAGDKTDWRIHACVLLGHHYHLLVKTPEASLVAGMKWLQGTYTQRFTGRHGLRGHLFQGRYQAVPVEAENLGCLGPSALKGRLGMLVAGKRRESHSDGAKRAHGEAAANALLAMGMAALGRGGTELRQRPKNAPEKTALAWWLRGRTTVSLLWVSEPLEMGHYPRVAQAVSRLGRKLGRKLEKLKRRLLQMEKQDA